MRHQNIQRKGLPSRETKPRSQTGQGAWDATLTEAVAVPEAKVSLLTQENLFPGKHFRGNECAGKSQAEPLAEKCFKNQPSTQKAFYQAWMLSPASEGSPTWGWGLGGWGGGNKTKVSPVFSAERERSYDPSLWTPGQAPYKPVEERRAGAWYPESTKAPARSPTAPQTPTQAALQATRLHCVTDFWTLPPTLFTSGASSRNPPPQDRNLFQTSNQGE